MRLEPVRQVPVRRRVESMVWLVVLSASMFLQAILNLAAGYWHF